MRFVLCIVIAALLPGSALAAKGGTMSFSRTQAAAARGDQQAAAALATTTYREACMSGCAAPWSSERSMRQRLPPGHLPLKQQAALLRGKVGAARSSTLVSL